MFQLRLIHRLAHCHMLYGATCFLLKCKYPTALTESGIQTDNCRQQVIQEIDIHVR